MGRMRADGSGHHDGERPLLFPPFIMAQQQGADADLAGQSVAFTTLFSVFTMFLIIFSA